LAIKNFIENKILEKPLIVFSSYFLCLPVFIKEESYCLVLTRAKIEGINHYNHSEKEQFNLIEAEICT